MQGTLFFVPKLKITDSTSKVVTPKKGNASFSCVPFFYKEKEERIIQKRNQVYAIFLSNIFPFFAILLAVSTALLVELRGVEPLTF